MQVRFEGERSKVQELERQLHRVQAEAEKRVSASEASVEQARAESHEASAAHERTVAELGQQVGGPAVVPLYRRRIALTLRSPLPLCGSCGACRPAPLRRGRARRS